MRSIKEVEFDYHTGKLSEDDYELYDQRMRQQAIGLIRQIEKRSPEIAGLDAEIGGVDCLPTQDQVSGAVVCQRRPACSDQAGGAAAVQETERHLLPQCGAKAKTSDKFCAQCGTALRVETA